MNLDNIADKLPLVDGVALHRLYKFHRACSAAAPQAIPSTKLFIEKDLIGLQRSDVMNRARKVLLEQPCPEAVTKDTFLEPLYNQHLCHGCQTTLRSLLGFSRLLGKKVEGIISEVRHNNVFRQHVTQ